ncbi:MAG: cobalamin-binding protein [Desulfobacteraceae bacterium 4572_123]|nr:MAG: cobalamin-binding protein [Desulfobacteraceae bacterium 4572_123]
MSRSILLILSLMLLLICAGLFVVATAMAEAHYITDSLGRVVEVPCEPKRVVALAPSITEIIYALERQEILKGATRFSDYPSEAEQLPKVGSYVQLDVERIAALKPDLCIGIATKDHKLQKGAAQLAALNIPFVALHPEDIETVMDSIEIVGELLNATDKAQQIIGDMRIRIARVKQVVASVPNKPKVFVQIGVTPIVSAGSATFINQLIETAGGINLAAGSSPYPRFSREQVICLLPEVLIITSMARSTVFERIKADWFQWPSIPAVAHNRVFIAPSNTFDRPTPRLVEGLEQMAHYIHPQLFGEKL